MKQSISTEVLFVKNTGLRPAEWNQRMNQDGIIGPSIWGKEERSISSA
jgi:hypothetical protein